MRLKKFLPPGKAFDFSEDSQFMKLVHGAEVELERAEAAVTDSLIAESSPLTATDTIDEWESMVGITDGAENDLATRRSEVSAKLTARGGQSKGYFKTLAASMGFTVTVTDLMYLPFVAGGSAGLPAFTRSAKFVWLIEITARTAAANISSLRSAMLKCRPAHTVFWIVTYDSWSVEFSGVYTAGYTVKKGTRLYNCSVLYETTADAKSTSAKKLTLNVKAVYPDSHGDWVSGSTRFVSNAIQKIVFPDYGNVGICGVGRTGIEITGRETGTVEDFTRVTTGSIVSSETTVTVDHKATIGKCGMGRTGLEITGRSV